MADPVFTTDDRVPSASGKLPPELEGKSPTEIVAYFQERERIFRDNEKTLQAELARKSDQPTRTDDQPDRPRITSDQVWQNPDKTIRDAVTAGIKAEAVGRAEFDKLAKSGRAALIAAAREACRRNHSDFDIFASDIEKVLNTVHESDRTDPTIWETSYTYVKGTKADELIAAARVSGMKGGPGERVQSGAPPAVDVPIELDNTQLKIIDRLGISADKYRAAQKAITADRQFPLTVDNRGGR